MHSARVSKATYVAAFLLGALMALLIAQPARAGEISAIAAPPAPAQSA